MNDWAYGKWKLQFREVSEKDALAQYCGNWQEVPAVDEDKPKEKSLEEKFEEARGWEVGSSSPKDLAEIAKKHFKEKYGR